MLSAPKYLSIVRERDEAGKPLERVYRIIRKPEILQVAYMNLYANQGAMTPGTDPEDIVDGMSTKRIMDLSDELRQGTFRWKPVRRVYIPKANGKKRPIGVPGWKDKMVQEAMRLVLSAYYEPQFSNLSHGFRNGRGCHTALTQIVKYWTAAKWFIEIPGRRTEARTLYGKDADHSHPYKRGQVPGLRDSDRIRQQQAGQW